MSIPFLRDSLKSWQKQYGLLYPILLPGQNYFCPGQNQNCPGQNIFCPRLKSSHLLEKRIENDFKMWKIFFSWLKSFFPSILHAKMYFFSLGQKCFICYQNHFVQDKNDFVPAEGWGIRIISSQKYLPEQSFNNLQG